MNGIKKAIKPETNEQDEPILTAVSSHSDGRTYVIFKDGALKIIQQMETNYDAIVLYIYREDMKLILDALKVKHNIE